MKKNSHIFACEICDLAEIKALERHHMVPRTDSKSTNDPDNLAVICSACHRLVHACEVIIEGRYLTTDGYKLFWHRKDQPFKIRPGIILNDDGTAVIVEK